MLPRIRLKTLFAFVGFVAIILACWVQNATRFSWTIACEWHSAAPIPGYTLALDRYRTWLIDNSFLKCKSPDFATQELRHANTQWFKSQKYLGVFVVTSGDQQNVRANIVVRVHDPLFNFRSTKSELRDYTDCASGELHKLWHPGLENQ